MNFCFIIYRELNFDWKNTKYATEKAIVNLVSGILDNSMGSLVG